MPRRNLNRPLPPAKWTDAERERGYRRWIDGSGREFVQCAPGRMFCLVHYQGIGSRVIDPAALHSSPKVDDLAGMFRGPVPVLCVIVSNDPETGLVFTTAKPGAGPGASPRPRLEDLPDYGEWSVSAPEPRPPLIGPVSAEHLASWVGFNAGRGERFLAEFVFSGLVPARRVSARVWEFEGASLSAWFPRSDWEAMLRAYERENKAAARQRIATLQREKKAGRSRIYKRRA